MEKCAKIWRFVEGPEEFRKLSEFGEKEDWVAHVPPNLVGLIPWFEPGKFSAKVSHHPQKDGSVVYIGAH